MSGERKKASLWLLIPTWTLATIAVLWTLVVIYAFSWDHWADPKHSPSPTRAKQVQQK